MADVPRVTLERVMADDLVKTVVTAREGALDGRTIALTPGAAPDIAVIPLPSWRIVLVRVLRVYLQSFVGFLGAMTTGALAPTIAAGTSGVTAEQVQAILPHAFWANVMVAASVACVPTFITLAQNALELMTRLDDSHPQWRA